MGVLKEYKPLKIKKYQFLVKLEDFFQSTA